MTLKEAIKGLIWLKDEAIFPKNQDDINALDLGIEALQFCEEAQLAAGGYYYLRLSGETKD